MEASKIYIKRSYSYPSFVNAFESFGECYKNLTKTQEAKDFNYKLLKMEQAMHTMSQSAQTQGVSAYLNLVEDYCFDRRISSLVELLLTKHTVWYDGYSEMYAKWMFFIYPYLRYLKTVDFQLQRILELDALDLEKIMPKCIQDLQCSLMKKGINLDLETTNVTSSYIIDKRSAFLETFNQKNVPHDKQYYYDLGLLSLIVHLRNYIDNKDSTFLQICVLTPSCVGMYH